MECCRRWVACLGGEKVIAKSGVKFGAAYEKELQPTSRYGYDWLRGARCHQALLWKSRVPALYH